MFCKRGVAPRLMATCSSRNAAPLVSPTTVPYCSGVSVGGAAFVFVLLGGAAAVADTKRRLLLLLALALLMEAGCDTNAFCGGAKAWQVVATTANSTVVVILIVSCFIEFVFLVFVGVLLKEAKKATTTVDR